jgi:hypothetical protein
VRTPGVQNCRLCFRAETDISGQCRRVGGAMRENSLNSVNYIFHMTLKTPLEKRFSFKSCARAIIHEFNNINPGIHPRTLYTNDEAPRRSA